MTSAVQEQAEQQWSLIAVMVHEEEVGATMKRMDRQIPWVSDGAPDDCAKRKRNGERQIPSMDFYLTESLSFPIPCVCYWNI